jgi:Flp pilus assembly protein TadG
MKNKIELHGQPEALKRGWNRIAALSGPSDLPKLLGRRFRSLLRTGDDGSAIIEFAMVLPMLLVITTGILVFGVAMNNYLQLNNAVSVGARTLAISAQMTLDPCATASAAITSAVPNLNPSNFTFTYVMNGTSYSGTSCSSASVSTGAAGNLASGTTVSVTATYPLNLSIFGQRYSANSAVLSATSTELVQ